MKEALSFFLTLDIFLYFYFIFLSFRADSGHQRTLQEVQCMADIRDVFVVLDAIGSGEHRCATSCFLPLFSSTRMLVSFPPLSSHPSCSIMCLPPSPCPSFDPVMVVSLPALSSHPSCSMPWDQVMSRLNPLLLVACLRSCYLCSRPNV